MNNLSTIPVELIGNIAEFLPKEDLVNFALAARVFLPTCQMKLSRTLDLTDGETLRLWLENHFEPTPESPFHTSTIICHTDSPVQKHAFNIRTFLESYLPKFPQLTRLTLILGPISLHHFGTPFQFAETLKVLNLSNCPMLFRELVTFLNQFPNLEHLTIRQAPRPKYSSTEPVQELSYPLKSLDISYTSRKDEAVDKLSERNLQCQELSLYITRNRDVAQKFIDGSKDSLRRLDLRYLAGCFDLSACKELHTVEMHLGSRSTNPKIISSITSSELRKIVLSSAWLSGDEWEGVDDALHLVAKSKIGVRVIVKVSERGHPKDHSGCGAIFNAFLPKFHKVGRVVLKEVQRKEGRDVVTVIYDSWGPVIACSGHA